MYYQIVICFALFNSYVSPSIYNNLLTEVDDLVKDIPLNVFNPPTPITQADIKMLLYTREFANVLLTPETLKHLDPKKQIKFILHGWMESSNRKWMKEMATAYLLKGDYQVVIVDWSLGAQKLYPIAKDNSKIAGAIIGNYLVELNKHHNIPWENIHLIGHSMGSMVSGFAGKEVQSLTGGEKIGRITGLDISGRKYVRPGATAAERIDKSDAHFVDITHTDPGQFGLAEPVGHVDFYVNNGTVSQPGCPELNIPSIADIVEAGMDFVYCDHVRSHAIFTESINSHGFLGQECHSWSDYISKECQGPKIIYGEDTPSTARGIYYFKTNAKPPYATNE